jgi:hypothetical protein
MGAAVALVVLGLVVLGLVVSVTALGGRSKSSVATPGRPLRYHVLYRTDTTVGGGDVTRWESLTVVRPFEASDFIYDARPEGSAQPASGYVSTERALYDVDSAGLHLVAAKQPGVPSGDEDLVTQLPDLLARHLAAETGSVRSVAGRQCRVYRLFEPPSGPIKPLADASDHDDVCLDGTGVILAEAWTYHSQLVFSRTAESVSFTGGIPSVGGASVPVSGPSLAPDPAPRSFVARPPTPVGFRPSGSYDFTIPDPQGSHALEASSVVWVFVRGTELVTVEAGTDAGGAMPWQPSDTPVAEVTLSGLGPAETAIRSDGAEVRIDLGHGEWVRVRGTETASWLARYAGGLRRDA